MIVEAQRFNLGKIRAMRLVVAERKRELVRKANKRVARGEKIKGASG